MECSSYGCCTHKSVTSKASGEPTDPRDITLKGSYEADRLGKFRIVMTADHMATLFTTQKLASTVQFNAKGMISSDIEDTHVKIRRIKETYCSL